ncbi:MAG: hypothetical protein LUG86_09280 [Oscillospiraceae bacterium]|nr:hypothetical protein [Oscillospiraceae bacterium]
MDFEYASDLMARTLVAILKAHGIKRVIASPGYMDVCLIASMQHDGSFEMYSCIDERGAAYMACGMAAETGEPVVLICTEATASRDYLPGLTEAYHRKLPILAITGNHGYSTVGHLRPQVIDRSVSPVDSIRVKVNLPVIKDEDDFWDAQIKINKAILALKYDGCGPVHINMPGPSGAFDFNEPSLPEVRIINGYVQGDKLPELPDGKIAIFVGSHKVWSNELTAMVDEFCARNDAVVFCDHSSKYYGKYAVHANLFAMQKCSWDVFNNIKLVIHFGEEAADEATTERMKKAEQTWRISEDGELRDPFRNLTAVFKMSDLDFFRAYTSSENVVAPKTSYLNECKACYDQVYKSIPELPFSYYYVASRIAPSLPSNSVIHIGVSNSIRVWSGFELPETVHADSNMGCRGIDGALSTSIGVSLMHPNQICFCTLGDLTFFYDMNSLGNRHVGNNYRVLIINNNGGNIFKQGNALDRRLGGYNCNAFIAAGGHYKGKESGVIRNYVQSLGFEYISADSKESFEEQYKRFVSPEITNPMLFEIFTEDDNECAAFKIMRELVTDGSKSSQLKQQVKGILGEKGTQIVKNLLHRK